MFFLQGQTFNIDTTINTLKGPFFTLPILLLLQMYYVVLFNRFACDGENFARDIATLSTIMISMIQNELANILMILMTYLVNTLLYYLKTFLEAIIPSRYLVIGCKHLYILHNF